MNKKWRKMDKKADRIEKKADRMELYQWLKKTNTSVNKIMQDLQIPSTSMNCILYKKRKVNLVHALKIAMYTDGEIFPEILISMEDYMFIKNIVKRKDQPDYKENKIEIEPIASKL
jgi:hypothetical protein